MMAASCGRGGEGRELVGQGKGAWSSSCCSRLLLVPAHLPALCVVRVVLLLPAVAHGEDVPAVEMLVAIPT